MSSIQMARSGTSRVIRAMARSMTHHMEYKKVFHTHVGGCVRVVRLGPVDLIAERTMYGVRLSIGVGNRRIWTRIGHENVGTFGTLYSVMFGMCGHSIHLYRHAGMRRVRMEWH